MPLRSNLLTAARTGDDHALHAPVAPHLRALHAHAYRTSGSYHDAEEAVPEVPRPSGRDTVIEFFATGPAQGRLDLIRLVATRADGDPGDPNWLDKLVDSSPST